MNELDGNMLRIGRIGTPAEGIDLPPVAKRSAISRAASAIAPAYAAKKRRAMGVRLRMLAAIRLASPAGTSTGVSIFAATGHRRACR